MVPMGPSMGTGMGMGDVTLTLTPSPTPRANDTRGSFGDTNTNQNTNTTTTPTTPVSVGSTGSVGSPFADFLSTFGIGSPSPVNSITSNTTTNSILNTNTNTNTQLQKFIPKHSEHYYIFSLNSQILSQIDECPNLRKMVVLYRTTRESVFDDFGMGSKRGEKKEGTEGTDGTDEDNNKNTNSNSNVDTTNIKVGTNPSNPNLNPNPNPNYILSPLSTKQFMLVRNKLQTDGFNQRIIENKHKHTPHCSTPPFGSLRRRSSMKF